MCPSVGLKQLSTPATHTPELSKEPRHLQIQLSGVALGRAGGGGAITDLRTWSKEGQEHRQQNQSIENSQDGKNSQDSEEVPGRRKGYGACQCERRAPKPFSVPRAQLSKPTLLKSAAETIVQPEPESSLGFCSFSTL